MLAPRSEQELVARAQALAGQTLGELAERSSLPVPPDLKRAKGWVGGLLESLLGASAGSRAQPDFPELGVELKTLPVDRRGRPVESTFVCTIELSQIADVEWEESRLWHKLRRVLWVPVQGERGVPVAQRYVGHPLLWSPNPQQESTLRQDWEMLASLISQGRTSEITGHMGTALQMRPKAAKGSSRRRAFDDEGAYYDEQPKGFYLRPSFTHGLLKEAFVLPQGP